MLALMVSNDTLAQRVGFPQSVPLKIKPNVASFTSTPSGYFSVRLKSANQDPAQWLQQNSQAIGLSANMSLEIIKYHQPNTPEPLT